MARKKGSKDRKKRIIGIAKTAGLLGIGAAGLYVADRMKSKRKIFDSKKAEEVKNSVKESVDRMKVSFKDTQPVEVSDKVKGIQKDLRDGLEAKKLQLRKQTRSEKLKAYRDKYIPQTKQDYYKRTVAKESDKKGFGKLTFGKITKSNRRRLAGFSQ